MSAENLPAAGGPPRHSRQEVAAAAAIAVTLAAFAGRQTLRMPPEVPQFSKYPLAVLQTLHGGQVSERLVDYSPLYLALHTAATRWLADPFAGVLVFQAACVGLASAFVFLALRRVAAFPLALAGAMALGLERSVLVHAYIFEPETLLLLFAAAWLFFALRPGGVAAAAAGAALGLALLTRPSLLPLAAAVPAARLVLAGPRRALAATGFSLLPVAAALLLLATHNHQATGSWSPVVMNPGTVFFDGNNPLGPGYAAAYPPVVQEIAAAHPEEADFEHAVYRLLARSDAGRELSVAEANRFWAEKALRYLRDEPAAALRRFCRKMHFGFHGYRWNDLSGANAADRALEERGLPATPVALLSALAIAGAGLGLRRWREFLPAYALLASQLAVMLGTYASARQRIALLPALCFFAAVSASRLARGGRRMLLAVGGSVLLLAALLARETDMMREHRHLYGRPPGSAPVGAGDPLLMDRAIALFKQGRLEDAAPLFEALREKRYASLRGEPAFFLGRIATRRGHREVATALMREALERAPGHPVYLAQLAVLTDEPVHAVRLQRYLDRADARYLLGDALLENGLPEDAAAVLEQLLAEVPEHETGRALLTRALTARDAARAAPGSSRDAAP